jgi:hypothetical protein
MECAHIQAPEHVPFPAVSSFRRDPAPVSVVPQHEAIPAAEELKLRTAESAVEAELGSLRAANTEMPREYRRFRAAFPVFLLNCASRVEDSDRFGIAQDIWWCQTLKSPLAG